MTLAPPGRGCPQGGRGAEVPLETDWRMHMLSPYKSPIERAWFWTHRSLCALVLLFLILPVLVIIPL